MNPKFIYYSKCGTCTKAAKWLKQHNIEVEVRDIVTNNPSEEELTQWISESGKAVSKFFNTSGLKYKQLNMKDIVKTASDSELISKLASDGMLVKRPLLISDKYVLIGFKEDEWVEKIGI